MQNLMRLPAVATAVGVSPLTVKRNWKKGLFPKPVKIGVRAIAFPEHEVAAVNAARIAGKSEDEIRQLVADLHNKRANAAA
ncbi:AlpA family transcriptional regulator [Sphingobium sp.]|uniref:helix-turn-helix transcriptional regulator n=1 Tax=Sphingobium sp. TaxID=1912891 RepID=UPI002620B565|nr:AlpA family phage regulatory protein [Sphingobium sp.]